MIHEEMMRKQENLSSPKHIDQNQLNVGVRLYQKGLKKQEEQERKRREMMELLERKKDEELIFHP
jgi:predicted nucleic acid-binding protein